MSKSATPSKALCLQKIQNLEDLVSALETENARLHQQAFEARRSTDAMEDTMTAALTKLEQLSPEYSTLTFSELINDVSRRLKQARETQDKAEQRLFQSSRQFDYAMDAIGALRQALIINPSENIYG